MLEVNKNERPITGAGRTEAAGPAAAADAAEERAPAQKAVKKLYLSRDVFERRNVPPETPPERPVNFINHFCQDAASEVCVRIHNTVPGAFEKYFKGEMDETTLFRTVDRSVSSLLNAYESMGFDPQEIGPDLLEDAYNLFRSDVVAGAFVCSGEEGRAVGRQLSCQSSYIYYNADYYYQSEELIDRLHAHMKELAEQSGFGPADFLRDYPKGDQRNQYYKSYNAYICSEARNACGNIIDEDMVPPRGFRMFYDSNGTGTTRHTASMGVGDGPKSFFDGVVYIECQGWSFTHRVPVRMDPTRFPVSVHLMDVVRSSGKAYPKELEGFLDNFDFFAMNVGRLYMDAHPRTY